LTSSPPTSPPAPADNPTSPSPTKPTYTQIYDQLSSEWPKLKDKLMQPAGTGPNDPPAVTLSDGLEGDE
jgi:hypothetical protein